MKSIIIFYDDENSLYKNEKSFDGKSSVDLSMNWAQKIGAQKIITLSKLNKVSDLLSQMVLEAQKNEADYVIFAYNDNPFLNVNLTQKLIEYHTNYHAEYTFADGFSKGFAPELIHTGTLSILAELSKNDKNLNDKSLQTISRDCIYNLIKTDINAFEIETVLSEQDFRLLRFNFDAENKLNYQTCLNLYEKIKQNKVDLDNCDANKINLIASKTLEVLKTIPSFYNIQIADKCLGKCIYCPYPKAFKEKNKIEVSQSNNIMNYENASKLIDQIADFSEEAVISLSLWGESFYNPDIYKIIEKILSYKGLSVFIETDGLLISDEVCNKLKEISNKNYEHHNKWPQVMIAVSIDAFSDSVYKKIRGTSNSISNVVDVVQKLNQIFPGTVYPQFVRMNANEEELEQFFRYWKEQENPSGGEFIIQKYDNFANYLKDEKTADLTPIERNVCWHLRRDMNILTNGDVVLCKEYLLENVIGNVFTDSLKTIWEKSNNLVQQHIENKIDKKCGDCDEFYTYNF